MTGIKLTLLFAVNFGIALAAGVVAGRALRPAAPESSTTAGRSLLSTQLQLTAEQSEQMRPIWEAAREVAHRCAAEGERIQQDNDAQLQSLLSEAQRARYARISAENHDRIAAEEGKRKDAFHEAVAQTRKILRPDQWKAYEQILNEQVGAIP